MVFIITFLGRLSMSSLPTNALPQSRSVLTVASQKQFNEWQKESDYAAETNATDKMALTDCVNELVPSRNGTLDFPALYSKLINTNSTATSF